MGMSFQEKSLWLMFFTLIGVFVFYFATVLPADGIDVTPHQVVLFVGAVAMLVAMQVVGSVVIAIADRRSDSDERDRLIGLKGTRNGAYVLATGVFLALCAALFTRGTFVFTHVLLGSWVLAQLVEIGSQLFLHRRGV